MAENKYSLMSYNILCDKPKPERIDRLIALVKKYEADTIGMQEVTPYWLSFLKPALDNYVCVGLGRDGEDKGEHSCIFYNKEKFDLISTETKWLSDTPDEVSRVEGSAYIRIVTFAVLERKSDGKRFVHANTHLDFGKAAVEQVKYLKKFAEKYEYPMFITGDFNFAPDSEGYAEFTKDRFVTSSAVAEDAKISNTFPACEDPTCIIDYCLVTPESIDVKSYKVCTEQIDGGYGSDHMPVYIEYDLK